MKISFLITTTILITALNGTAYAQDLIKGQCALKYKTSVNAKGPCTVYQYKDIVSIKGTVDENGQTYIATINNAKNEGLLIGAGTFTIADGKLSVNKATKVSWPNGYILTVKID